MKRALIFTLAAASATANPLAYPADHKWNFSLSIENGIEKYDQNNPSRSPGYIRFPIASTGYKLLSRQTAGFGKWFYLQSRLSYTLGYTSSADAVNGSIGAKSDTFFDGDWSLILPFRIPSRRAITLGPQFGLAYMRHREKLDSDGDLNSKLTYLAPLFGIVLGLQPTEHFAIRTGLNLQVPKVDYKQQYVGQYYSQSEFRRKRHSINAFLNLMYKVSKYLEITGTLEHKSYSVQYPNNAYNYADRISQMSRTSATCGLNWAF